MKPRNINPNPHRSRSQKAAILKYLQAGGTLTPLEAVRIIGTMKLATRVSELISEGHSEIRKRMVYVMPDGLGGHPYRNELVRVMQYYIPAELRKPAKA